MHKWSCLCRGPSGRCPRRRRAPRRRWRGPRGRSRPRAPARPPESTWGPDGVCPWWSRPPRPCVITTAQLPVSACTKVPHLSTLKFIYVFYVPGFRCGSKPPETFKAPLKYQKSLVTLESNNLYNRTNPLYETTPRYL